MHQRFQGKIALVTGASTGIGRAVAIRLAGEGASVVIDYYRGDEDAAAAVEACERAHAEAGVRGAGVIAVQADVSDEVAVAGLFEQTLQRFGRLDVLVNNAGIQLGSPSEEVDMAAYDAVVNVNLRGAFLCSRAALKHFLSRPGGGAIVNNTSVHELIPKPQYVSYAISKGGMEQMTRTLALEYADRGIRVNSIGPGAIVTPINQAWIDDQQKRQKVEANIPMGRAGTPEEMAAVVAFLASDDASYVTGQTLFACGGLTLFPLFRTNWATEG